MEAVIQAMCGLAGWVGAAIELGDAAPPVGMRLWSRSTLVFLLFRVIEHAAAAQ